MSNLADDVTRCLAFLPNLEFIEFAMRKLELRLLLINSTYEPDWGDQGDGWPYFCAPRARESESQDWRPVGCLMMMRVHGWFELGGFRLLGQPRKGDKSDPLNVSDNQHIFTLEDAENNEVVANLWDCIANDAQKMWWEIVWLPSCANLPLGRPWLGNTGQDVLRKDHMHQMMNFFSPEDADSLCSRNLQFEHRKTTLERRCLEIDVAMTICRIRVEWLDDGGKIAKSHHLPPSWPRHRGTYELVTNRE